MSRYFKLVFAITLSLYFFWCAAYPANWHFIDNVNLFIHEGGHIIFLPFGEFMHVLGGSLTQVVMPLLFVIYFYFQNQFFSATVTLFWVGENLLNVSVYVGDAVRMQLPLLFGDNSIHDWNWLLIYTGQLHHTAGIANTIYFFGVATIVLAAVGCIYYSLQDEQTN